MFTSDTDIFRRAVKTAFVYLLLSVLCALFGGIYELYSHGVYSYYMIYAFVIPLVGGTLCFLLLAFFCGGKYPCKAARDLYHSALAAFTVGSIVKGVLDIYGTTNFLSGVYFPAGLLLLVSSVILQIFHVRQKNN